MFDFNRLGSGFVSLSIFVFDYNYILPFDNFSLFCYSNHQSEHSTVMSTLVSIILKGYFMTFV